MASTTARSCLLLLALYVCLVNHTEGGTFGQPAPEDPAHPGKCYNSKLHKAVAVGESITDHSDCTQLTCYKHNATTVPVYMLHGVTCSYVRSFPANCHVVDGDPAADFPDCCTKLECDGPPQGSIRGVG